MPQFLDSTMLWWLAAAIPAITILYFLKLRRQSQVISSTLLWRRSVYDLRVNAPIQMIRRNLLLLLQLLVICLVILGMARPFTKLRRATGRKLALVIDCSASMGTRDEIGGKTRLEAAKEEALRIIDNLGVAKESGGDDTMCVILAAERALPLCPLTDNKTRLRQAVQSIQLRDTQTDMAKALRMAVDVTGVARTREDLESGTVIESGLPKPPEDAEDYSGLTDPDRQTQATVLILSDGAFPAVPKEIADKLTPAADDEEDIASGSRFIRLGQEESHNLAIVVVDIVTDPTGVVERQLFVRVENMGEEAREAVVEVMIEGEFVDRKTVDVPPRDERSDAPGQAGMVFALEGEATGVLSVRLAPAEGESDPLTVDNVVHAVLTPPTPIRALLVSREGNYFLENALDALSVSVDYDSVAPVDYETGVAEDEVYRDAGSGGYEIVIFDRWAPKNIPPGASFYLGTVPEESGIASGETLFIPWVIDWNSGHPLMRNIMLLDRLSILKCRRMELSGGWATVIDGQALELESAADLQDDKKVAAAPVVDTSLLGCLISDDRRVAVLAFDIYDTQRWPMRVSFPVFIKNATHWLARPGGLHRARLFRTGETLRVSFDEDVGDVKVKTPWGESVGTTPAGRRSVYFSDTHRIGIYTILGPGNEQKYAFNLLSSSESDNRARPAVLLGEEELAARAQESKRNTDLWPYLVAGALAFLLLEWYIYNRRILG